MRTRTNQIRSESRRMRKQGKTLHEIAEVLAQKGVYGRDGKSPISRANLSRIILSKPSKRPVLARASKGQKDRRLTAVREILRLQIDPLEVIALAQLVIG